MNDQATRALAALATVLLYAAMCVAIGLRERRRRAVHARAAAGLARAPEGRGSPATLVLYATQTGQAQALAWRTAEVLHASGDAVRVLSLDDVDIATLAQARRACVIASTYGEGDAPDGASAFAARFLGARAPNLSTLRYAVLALGDRQYANFCAFGRAVDAWLAGAGAAREFERIEVDNGEPAALARWQAQWSGDALAPADAADAADVAGTANAAEPTQWRLTQRTHLNPGSAGAPIFHLAFEPARTADGAEARAPRWQAGDIARLTLAGDPGRPRDYSIASIPADGQLQLLVRQERHPDGTLGAGSGLLTSAPAPGAMLALALRPHPGFRLGDNAQRPLILIGNGTGLAGLRSHLRARALAGQHDNWLVFGERNHAHDFLCRDEIEAWQAQRVLARLDMVFSRDQAQRRYVQHCLLDASDTVREWLARGAAVYVCGSLHGMAGGVDAALQQIAGAPALRALAAAGRYRRDVY